MTRDGIAVATRIAIINHESEKRIAMIPSKRFYSVKFQLYFSLLNLLISKKN